MGVVDRMVPTEMELSPGMMVQAMVHDVLSGRPSLYRIEQFWQQQDKPLLLGEEVNSHINNDTNLGRSFGGWPCPHNNR